MRELICEMKFGATSYYLYRDPGMSDQQVITSAQEMVAKALQAELELKEKSA